MSDEEEDYMSDKLLASLGDVRPSLIKSHAKKREVKVAEKHIQHIKRQRNENFEKSGANRNERLQESLQRPIEQSNKGFQLLAKMGYKPGEALGKATGSAGGITEPIGISIKSDRGGLGRAAALLELTEKRKKLREKYMQRMRQEAAATTTEEYRRRVTSKAEEHFLQQMLRNCQKACENLDITQAKITAPSISWFWPERNSCDTETDDNAQLNGKECDKNTEEVEIEEEYSLSEKLDMLTNYMRTAYNYCLWCGVHYTDARDMDTSCPGSERDDH